MRQSQTIRAGASWRHLFGWTVIPALQRYGRASRRIKIPEVLPPVYMVKAAAVVHPGTEGSVALQSVRTALTPHLGLKLLAIRLGARGRASPASRALRSGLIESLFDATDDCDRRLTTYDHRIIGWLQRPPRRTHRGFRLPSRPAKIACRSAPASSPPAD